MIDARKELDVFASLVAYRDGDGAKEIREKLVALIEAGALCAQALEGGFSGALRIYRKAEDAFKEGA